MENVNKTKESFVKVTDSFWRSRMDVVRDQVIPYQWDALNDRIPDAAPSHAVENFRIAAGEAEGEFQGMVFQDSDLMKWLEAVAYSLENDPNPELESQADAVIDLFEKAQQEDGYLDTYFIVKEPEKRWTNLRDWHELYCAGHMIEAAVAYFKVTGKSKFLDIVCRFADYIDSVFGPEEQKLNGYPGHQEIELALVKLYRVTGNERYLNLSQYFIDERGKQPHYFDIEKEARGDNRKFWWKDDYGYLQAHLPVREQTKAVGHSVRAMYMYTAMADLAKEIQDESLWKACQTLWDNVTKQQMYITGGIGSQEFGESFSFDYDLPNDLCYTETCASIGLVFWARRMLEYKVHRDYADVMEKALYNGTMSGMDLDGKRFFYVNPLEVSPKTNAERKDREHAKPVRQKWYACACCPPNLARLIASIGHYIYSANDQEAFIHLYVGSQTELDLAGQKVLFSQQTNYPWDETVNIKVTPEHPAQFTVAVRIPGWCRKATLNINGEEIDLKACLKDGYAYIHRLWTSGDQIELYLHMPVERMRANPKVRANAGKVALQRGPVVYCLEGVDNGADLHNIVIPRETEFNVEFKQEFLNGLAVITCKGQRINATLWEDDLYSYREDQVEEISITAIPYYAWCNREPGEMMVWVSEK
ncbi:DUF1680 family protein [Pullulanibacillus pueri]|uniref:Glycoside hydrolase family 127 protein n=1 Tax=Pullulanibacillus pueri TaxID=1437324 RepID=A0A8J2ZXY4_9BACL|nr:beta-L-arabinofuranosidase domain-containing protein [Pullulanibacillus pueri]MBM7683001.1 DUF1680 family protein [Pullulanibacillus pueri]GGH85904.1 hypothetical protein GCM10007096_32370 [Pullulanibacillus pueri]